MKPIVDVSKHQGAVNWSALSNSVDGAIIRAGYGKEISQKDPFFEQNYQQAKAAGLPVGAYWYSYATSVAAAVEEAKVCLEVLDGKQLDLPLYFDQEEQRTPENIRTECAVAFLDYIKQHSEYVRGFYASTYWLRGLNLDYLMTVCETLWQADYRQRPEILPITDLHQHTSKAAFPGVNGNVDSNKQIVNLHEKCKNLRKEPCLPNYPDISEEVSRVNEKIDHIANLVLQMGTMIDKLLCAQLAAAEAFRKEIEDHDA